MALTSLLNVMSGFLRFCIEGAGFRLTFIRKFSV